MFDTVTILTVGVIFLLAGLVKGVTGLGLPTVSLALLTVLLDMRTGMALILVPSFLTNIWQASRGGAGILLLRRLWPFLLPAMLTVWIGALALSSADLALLPKILGGLLVLYALLSLSGFKPALTPRQQIWMGPLLGAVNGLLTGMTGSFVVPGVLYLQACNLKRDALVQAMGMLFLASTIALAVSLQGNELLSKELGLSSSLAVVPALAGVILGQTIRRRLSEPLFRKVLFLSLLLLGIYILAGTS